jgi:hypothetical protein
MPPINIAARSSPANFKKALNRLSTDDAFRQAVTKDPAKLTTEYHLSLKELHALRQAAVLSGVDMTEINKIRGAEIARMHGNLADIDINISCCCCCCCGETGVVRSYA